MLFVGGCDFAADAHLEPWSVAVAEPVRPAGPVRLHIGRRLAPASVNRGTVQLFSGAVGEFVFPAGDPVREELVVDLTRQLVPAVTYVLRIDGVVDLDGDAPAEAIETLFTVEPQETPPVAPPVDTVAVFELLRARCGTAQCHASGAMGADVLDLSGPQGVAQTAIDVPSSQMRSVHARADATSGLADLPIVDGDGATDSPSRSYLLYKVLGDAHILGELMPPASAGPALDDAEVALLSAWIRAGAPLD